MNRKFAVTGITVVVFFSICLYLYVNNAFNTSVVQKANQPEKTRKVDLYYLPVTGYWSKVDEVSSDELAKRVNYIEEGESENLKAILGENFKAVEKKKQEIQSGISDTEIALVKWNSATPNLKPLKIDGKFLWDIKSDEMYPLKISKEYREDQIIPEEFSSAKVTKIIAGGDVMLSRHVATKIRSLGEISPWQKIADYFKSSDISFINLEVPLSDLYPAPKMGMNFIAPKKYVAGLIYSGIDIVSVANNHTANFGQKVFEDNLKTLAENKIESCGGGINNTEARKPKIIKKNGTRFAFLCYNAITGGLSADNDSGSAFLSIEPWYRDDENSIKNLEKDIRNAKKVSDVVIVSPHWGEEYKLNPNKSQQKVARRAIDAGADLIIGTHPHVVQGSEFYNGKYVTYSLGNLIFDQEWSTETKQGTVLENYFYGTKQLSARLTPIQIENYYQPRFVNADLANQIITRIKSASVGF